MRLRQYHVNIILLHNQMVYLNCLQHLIQYVYDKENNHFRNNLRRGRFKFDLHGFTLDNANKKVKEIIFLCVKKKYEEILFITGNGFDGNSHSLKYLAFVCEINAALVIKL